MNSTPHKSKHVATQAHKGPFAEVVESTLSSYVAQSWEWNLFPSFGELVFVEHEERKIFGIVTDITTGSIDGVRYPFPYKKTEAELMAEQPQIFEFLKTTFKVHIVGYMNPSGTLYYLLPSQPCKIHAFINECSPTLQSTFLAKADFLHLLFAFQSTIQNLDELLLAIIRHMVVNKISSEKLLEEFFTTFSLLTSNDYRRLKIFLRRVQEII